MNGFLQRLAARALGQPAAIHAATASPMSMPAAEPMPAGAEALPTMPHSDDAAPATRQTRPASPTASPPVAAVAAQQPLAAPLPVPQARNEAREHQSDIHPPAQTPPREQALHEPAPRAPDADLGSRANRPPPVLMPPAASGEAASILSATPPQPTGESAPAATQPVPSNPLMKGERLPEPLLPPTSPEAPRPRAGQISAALPARPQFPGPAVEETTEVHVSIGRIEITAVHEAPPSRPAPRAGKGNKPMSLDEYLARRQGGGA